MVQCIVKSYIYGNEFMRYSYKSESCSYSGKHFVAFIILGLKIHCCFDFLSDQNHKNENISQILMPKIFISGSQVGRNLIFMF